MKIILFSGLCFLCFNAGVFAQHGMLTLKVDRIDLEKGGKLSIAVFDEKNFLNTGQQLYDREVDVTAEQMEIIIEKIPEGTYAVAVFQDIDRSNDLKTNFIGFPQEPFGFSNNARIRFGPPSFSDAQFKVESDKNIILKIVLR